MQQDTFNAVLQEVAEFYAHIIQTYQTSYGIGTATFTHIPATRQIHIGVNVPSQYVLAVHLTIEHKLDQWYINGACTNMSNLNLHHLFRRVHIGTIKALEFLESKRAFKDWCITYDENNIIHIIEGGVECTISIFQNVPITDMAVSGIFETASHKTGFMSLDDVKSLVGTTNTMMDTTQNWEAI